MKRRLRQLLPVLALLAFGCAPAQQLPPDAFIALRDGTNFELISLDPVHERAVLDGEWQGEVFHNQAVIGSTSVEDATVRAALLDALVEAVAEKDLSADSKCFYPRHGIRVLHNGQQHDFVICFQCEKAGRYIDGEAVLGFYLAKTLKQVFDKVLQDAGVPLPEK